MHTQAIEKIRREPLEPRFRAVCSCGDKSEPGQYDEAQTAKRRHGQLVALNGVTS